MSTLRILNRHRARAWAALLALALDAATLPATASAATPAARTFTTTHEAIDLPLTAAGPHHWWEFPVRAAFRHAASGRELTLSAFWHGGDSWVLRFAPPLAGEWTFSTTSSADAGLQGVRGVVQVAAPTPAQLQANPNYRGQLALSPNGRHFTYADGTPFFLLADTGWAANTARCGLGENRDGPFYQYLADRHTKGFTTILLKHMRGIGDTKDPAGQRNEGGYPFALGAGKELNPEYFRHLDTRVRAIWEQGLAHGMPVAWFGKRKCFFTLEEAKRITAYFMVRYGAFNGLFALSGEYQYAFRDCQWPPAAYDELGRIAQAHNAYRKPVSLHPSSNTRYPPPHNNQSSSPYHHSGWLDHNWLQTGQQLPQLPNVISRTRENYRLEPARPVFLSEAHYERAGDPEHAYHARWQAWSAFLHGAAGYGYGALGVWQFRDPSDPLGETGNADSSSVVWQEALRFEGSAQVGHVRRLLATLRWWELAPRTELIVVDGPPAPLPATENLSAPSCAALRDELFVTYVPRGNASRKITLGPLGPNKYRASWYNPRSGLPLALPAPPPSATRWEIPARPKPADEDWVLVVEAVRP